MFFSRLEESSPHGSLLGLKGDMKKDPTLVQTPECARYFPLVSPGSDPQLVVRSLTCPFLKKAKDLRFLILRKLLCLSDSEASLRNLVMFFLVLIEFINFCWTTREKSQL